MDSYFRYPSSFINVWGKDPNRYRPSAEALRRRILRGLPLYKIDTLVDIVNLVSIRSGYSIGGFDADKIVGGLELGVGKEGEIYHGIGRGELNIAGLPVYRDGVAGVGTPTSDEERTKIEMSTTSLLMILNGYSGKEGLLEAGGYSVDLLKRYVSAVNVEAELICEKQRKNNVITVLILFTKRKMSIFYAKKTSIIFCFNHLIYKFVPSNQMLS